MEITRNRAKCFWSIEGPKRTIEAEEWKKERIGRPSLTPIGFGEYLKTIEKACLQVKCVVNEKDGMLVIKNMEENYEEIYSELLLD